MAQAHDIRVVPHQLIWDGVIYFDGEGLTPSAFYQRFRADSTYPTTTTPTLGQFVETYRRAAETAQGIVSIHVTGTLTSTVRLARQAAEQVDTPVRVVDSGTAATPQAFIALEAARAAERGV